MQVLTSAAGVRMSAADRGDGVIGAASEPARPRRRRPPRIPTIWSTLCSSTRCSTGRSSSSHNVGLGEEDRPACGRAIATKVIFPFDKADLSLGGQFLFVDQAGFLDLLTRHLDYTDLSLTRDLAVLRCVDKLPTLDPFLLREILKQHRIEAGRCYYRFSRADKAEMLNFVSSEIEALIRMCFGELKANDKRTRLSQLLLADQDSAELDPLRITFGMGQAEFAEAMFSWKALLYYRWRSRDLAPALKATLTSISAIQVRRYERDELSFILRATRVLIKVITSSWREVGQGLRLYDRAFASLTDRQSPDSFRSFLMHSSELFLELGDRIGRLEQATSLWSEPLRRRAHHRPVHRGGDRGSARPAAGAVGPPRGPPGQQGGLSPSPRRARWPNHRRKASRGGKRMAASIRRVVTGHDEHGKSVVLSDGPPPQHHGMHGPAVGADFVEIWNAPEPVPRLTSIPAAEPNERAFTIMPASGHLLRIIEMYPAKDGGSRTVMHRTSTLDYVVVIEGEVVLVLTDSEVVLKPGDVVVQRGTDHAWENPLRRGRPHGLLPHRRRLRRRAPGQAAQAAGADAIGAG